jgi:enoyl-CoA hydratase/carnithine racemase
MENARPIAMPEHLQFGVTDGVATVRLNRPEKRNAVSQQMWSAIIANLRETAANPSVRALVFEGTPGVFCAGADLASVKNRDTSLAEEYRRIALEGYAAVRDFPRPTLAVIDGPCIGGGCNIALACDIRFASPLASFAVPAVRHGIAYDEWTVNRLIELIGSGRAAHFLFSAARLGAEQAERIGLVDVRTDDIAAETSAFLRDLMLADDMVVDGIRRHIHNSRR